MIRAISIKEIIDTNVRTFVCECPQDVYVKTRAEDEAKLFA